MLAGGKLMLLLGVVSLTAAQQCQNYWQGTAPFCKPDSSCSAGHAFFGLEDPRGDGAKCLTGKKKLCQCTASGGLPACQPRLPPLSLTILNGWVTICHNGCNIYICGIKFFRFWKREEDARVPTSRVYARRYPCEEHPEQPHCQQPEPPQPPPQPTNEISSRPLTPDEVRGSFQQTEMGALIERVAALGYPTSGKSKDELVQMAYGRFEGEMARLDLGQVNVQASFANFESGAWTEQIGPLYGTEEISALFLFFFQINMTTTAALLQKSSTFLHQSHLHRRLYTTATRSAAASRNTAQQSHMLEWLAIIPDHPGMLEKRMEIRSAEARDSDFWQLGGALLDNVPQQPGQGLKINGSIMLVQAESREEVLQALQRDIYHTSAVWDLKSAQILPFKSAFRKALVES
ncbi:MAG: hypothetical protein L6R40_002655 [Gallowayella cf. fulva]|nr:MAG: hypothetical protein L6R40_002655 [Xanthomendoza cf. fulva]